MSVEASKWARMADVQKSSSKLVLLNLAQLVRYDADHWTVFASIDYLAKVTHLNRKTVIEALGRLRDLGAIQDTGRRAGDNRSSIIYRLCPNAVPLIDLAATGAVAGGEPQATQQDLALQDGFEVDDGNAPPASPANDRETNANPSGPSERDGATVDESLYLQKGDAPSPHCGGPDGNFHSAGESTEATGAGFAGTCLPTSPAAGHRPASKAPRGAKRKGRKRPPEARGAGAGPTRLPASWTLPEQWRSWTQQQRPLWTQEKIDAMAATFSAYMRSRPGELGMSPDWFESWRLWVFRERDAGETAGMAWQNSWTGIVATGKKLGVEQAPNEPPPHFKARVFLAAGLVPSH
ncbi:helix-turn-helix domain-containing protein [Achromobacter sp. MYb9]|uniref:helix-turn-helix domain-containing protein n=1 Tax=Achromobacter sp. MYb9 TaxID=1827284 RepID=UPI0011B20982|nr:helix-turn-helix domain-containing protein [Achromobacter sp. MYb9]